MEITTTMTDVLGNHTVEWVMGADGEYRRAASDQHRLAIAQERTWHAVPLINWEWNEDPAWNAERASGRRVMIAEECNRNRVYIPGSKVSLTSGCTGTRPDEGTGPDGQTPAKWAANGWRHKCGGARKKIAKRRVWPRQRRKLVLA